jgi:hypothetical protein
MLVEMKRERRGWDWVAVSMLVIDEPELGESLVQNVPQE